MFEVLATDKNNTTEMMQVARTTDIENALAGHFNFRQGEWSKSPRDPLGYRPGQDGAREWVCRFFPGEDENSRQGFMAYMTLPEADEPQSREPVEFFVHTQPDAPGGVKHWHWWSDMSPEDKAAYGPADPEFYEFMMPLIRVKQAGGLDLSSWSPGDPPLQVIEGDGANEDWDYPVDYFREDVAPNSLAAEGYEPYEVQGAVNRHELPGDGPVNEPQRIGRIRAMVRWFLGMEQPAK